MKDASRLAWHRITANDIDRIREALSAKYRVATVNRALTALRQVLWFAWRASLLTEDEYRRLAAVRQVRGDDLPPGREVRGDELAALYAACARDQKPQGRRDALAIGLMHAGGLRAGEAAALRMSDVVDARSGRIFVRGKGGREDVLTIGAATPLLGEWLEVRGETEGPLLVRIWASGKVDQDGLGARAVSQIVRKRILEAGLPHAAAHDLRRTFATLLFRAGCDHVMVKRALRHRDLQSVAKYDRRPASEVEEAMRRAIAVPIHGGTPR